MPANATLNSPSFGARSGAYRVGILTASARAHQAKSRTLFGLRIRGSRGDGSRHRGLFRRGGRPMCGIRGAAGYERKGNNGKTGDDYFFHTERLGRRSVEGYGVKPYLLCSTICHGMGRRRCSKRERSRNASAWWMASARSAQDGTAIVSQSRLWSDRSRAGSRSGLNPESACRARALPIVCFRVSQRHPQQPAVRGASSGCGPSSLHAWSAIEKLPSVTESLSQGVYQKISR